MIKTEEEEQRPKMPAKQFKEAVQFACSVLEVPPASLSIKSDAKRVWFYEKSNFGDLVAHVTHHDDGEIVLYFGQHNKVHIVKK